MAWSQAELDALKSAYALGVRRVAYDGKSTDYDDEAGLKRRINAIEREIAVGKKQPMCRLAGFSKD